MSRRPSSTHVWVGTFLTLLAVLFACGSDTPKGGGGDDPNGNGPPGLGGGNGEARAVASLAIDPPSASVVIEDGQKLEQPFKAVATYGDGTTETLVANVTWSAGPIQAGKVGPNGVYTTNGSVGGDVVVTATAGGKKATASLRIKLRVFENPNSVDPAVVAALQGAKTPDADVKWAYPYDGTVFPRGLNSPRMMWNGGGAGDAYLVRVVSDTFELESVATIAPPARYSFADATWHKLADSISGPAKLTVARAVGTTATVIVQHTWTIAPASMRGTIYYWANDLGRVMRLKPGAAAPDDFSNGKLGSLPASGCTMTCHTVSADGSTIVSGGDTLGGSYDLLKDEVIFDTGGAPESEQKRLWSNPALSPDGKFLVQNGSTDVPGPPGAMDGLWKTADGTRVAASGLEGRRLGMPAFAPDGTKIAYVEAGGANAGTLSVLDFDMKTVKAGPSTALVPQGAGARIAWPSVTPDAKWAIYHRGPIDSRKGKADLFLASTTTAGQEVRLSKLNGDGYPFVAGDRDRSFNFEPTFAPVASGGYFWVVFTSRRTYGNLLVGDALETKQLWVSAIDINPAPGVDPSHPPFLLQGQNEATANMRGFWALDPCKGDGAGCQSGTECCGGFCDGSGPTGALVCASAAACANDGDRCDVTADCCNAAVGTQCINHVCSEPGPK